MLKFTFIYKRRQIPKNKNPFHKDREVREKKKERKRKRNGYRTNQKKAETKEWKRAETETRNMIIKQENKICKSKKERNLVTT